MRISLLFKAFGLAFLLACSSVWAAASLSVVASFSILADVAQHLGGERIQVQPLVAADTDTQSYQLTPGDIRKIRSAKLLLVNGLGLEGAQLQRAMRDSKIPMVVATKGIATMAAKEDEHDDHGHGHGHDHADPHVWQDPVRMQAYARNVANALIQADPAGRAYYEQRLAAYQRELQQLHAWAQQQFASIPVAQRKVLTAHDAFAYLGARYQITFIAPQGASADSAASAKTVARIIQQVRGQGIRAIFLENVKDDRLMQQLARETGIAVAPQTLYSDALSGPQGAAGSYLQLMRHNIGAIATALHAAP